jgi:para-aminobenzoate synthetase
VKDGYVHNVVISPGPGTPRCPQDIGCVLDVLNGLPDVPILGVCLGHQALAAAHGGKVHQAPEPVHGRLSGIQHNGHALFDGIPSGAVAGYRVVRYHSLIVDEATLPPELQPICWTDGGDCALTLADDTDDKCAAAESGAPHQRLLMGVAHEMRPHYGVQFHPESVATAHGARLLANFAHLTLRHLRLSKLPPAPPLPAHILQSCDASTPAANSIAHRAQLPAAPLVRRSELSVNFEGIECGNALPDGAAVMEAMGWAGADDTFWLDSSDEQRGRFSFLGGPGGPLWRRVTYRLPSMAASNGSSGTGAAADQPRGTVTVRAADGSETRQQGPLQPWIARFLEAHRVPVSGAQAGLPFDFWGGLVGYVGYEVKAECGATQAHASRCA